MARMEDRGCQRCEAALLLLLLLYQQPHSTEGQPQALCLVQGEAFPGCSEIAGGMRGSLCGHAAPVPAPISPGPQLRGPWKVSLLL